MGVVTFKEVRKYFYYRNGWLYNRINRGRVTAGTIAGCRTSDGYINIGFKGKKYPAHRLIYIYHHGNIPDGYVVDHINKNKRDNRISNLRAVPVKQNSRNARVKSNNKYGVTGVSWERRTKKWHAQIMVNGRNKGLGRYKFFENAVIAHYQGEMKYGFTKQNPKSSAYDYLIENYGYIPSLDEIEDY